MAKGHKDTERGGVIQKIQRQSGCLLVAIGLGMLAFLLPDIFKNIGGGGISDNTLGIINGTKVDYTDFDAKYKEFSNRYLSNNPQATIGKQEQELIRNSVWDFFKQELLYKKEQEKVGLIVPPDELEDKTYGNNPHPIILQFFPDKENGGVNKSGLLNFLQQGISSDPQAKEQWLLIEDAITNNILETKYTAYLQKSIYTTDLEIKYNHEKMNKSSSIEFVGLEFNSVKQDEISFDNDDLKSFLNKNKSKYQQDESRDIEYAIINLTPSKGDSMAAKESLEKDRENFANTENDSTFLDIRGISAENIFDFQLVTNLTPKLANAFWEAPENTVSEVMLDQNQYVMVKVLASQPDSAQTVRVRQILIRDVKGPNESNYLSKTSTEVIGRIKSGQSTFEKEMNARGKIQFGNSNGDLGWIRKGEPNFSVSKEIISEAFKHRKGEIYTVKTSQGIHILQNETPVFSNQRQFAILSQKISIGTNTAKEKYQIANELIASLEDASSFEDALKEIGISKRVARKIKEDDTSIPGFSNPTKLITWLYGKGQKEGSLMQEAMEMDNKYVIAKISKIRKEGTPSLEDIRPDIEPQVVNLKKGEFLKKKIEDALSNSKDLSELANQLNTLVRKDIAFQLAKGSIEGIGGDRKLMGVVDQLPTNKMSEVLVGEVGVFVFNKIEEKNATEILETTRIKKLESNALANRWINTMRESLEKTADVKDFRNKFFN
ncbi:MAG: hypothetical protein CNE98_06755 [Bacteroidetes bacterium MED-G17]|nr:MAG: hypothetical protein CNE98_06755 [Bacteroidetes bacterium MED-G17]CAI8282357.1 MAG: Uncharacterised protein [Bacteroidetes bacterium MED-G17]|tara:strand:+ start:55036 stop:57192 length:2157 start_codon:yes stop_codon:yes gene_type:complete